MDWLRAKTPLLGLVPVKWAGGRSSRPITSCELVDASLCRPNTSMLPCNPPAHIGAGGLACNAAGPAIPGRVPGRLFRAIMCPAARRVPLFVVVGACMACSFASSWGVVGGAATRRPEEGPAQACSPGRSGGARRLFVPWSAWSMALMLVMGGKWQCSECTEGSDLCQVKAPLHLTTQGPPHVPARADDLCTKSPPAKGVAGGPVPSSAEWEPSRHARQNLHGK